MVPKAPFPTAPRWTRCSPARHLGSDEHASRRTVAPATAPSGVPSGGRVAVSPSAGFACPTAAEPGALRRRATSRRAPLRRQGPVTALRYSFSVTHSRTRPADDEQQKLILLNLYRALPFLASIGL